MRPLDTQDALLVVALSLGALLLLRALDSALRSRRVRRRARRAVRGEHQAERLLRRRGFVVEGRQITREFRFRIAGRDERATVRCDLLVRKGGRRFVAEVKTGTIAPRIEHAPTRRQLLEYGLAFDVDGVLLVDVEAGEVQEVSFPHLTSPRPSPLGYAAAFALGLLVARLLWPR